MKKVIGIIVGLIVVIVLGVYVLLFTQLGNNILKPTVQDKLSKALNKKVTVESFVLRPSYLELKCSAFGKRFLDVSGKFSLFSRNMDLNYTLDIDNVSRFFEKSGLTGSLRAKGAVKGEFDDFSVSGEAKVFGSNVDYLMNFKDKELSSISVKTNDLDIAKLLKIMNMPVYVSGHVLLDAKMSDLQHNGRGGAVVVINDGFTNPDVLKQQFGFENAKIPFKSKFNAKAIGEYLNVTGGVLSGVANLDLADGIVDLKKGSFVSNFLLKIPDLDRLYFATKHHMRGSLAFDGNLKVHKKLVVNAVCKDFAGGLLNLKLKGDKLKADYNRGKLVKLLYMLEYPKVFDSTINAKLKYNLKDKKGESHIVLLNGHFLPNRMTYLINTLLGFDMTKELYEQSTVDSRINDGVLVSDLSLKSKHTAISSKNAYVNLKTNQIDAVLDMNISGKRFKVRVKGDMNRPVIKVDIKDLLKNKLKFKGKSIEIPKSIMKLF